MDRQGWFTKEFVLWLVDQFNSVEEENCKLTKRFYDPYTTEHLLDQFKIAKNKEGISVVV